MVKNSFLDQCRAEFPSKTYKFNTKQLGKDVMMLKCNIHYNYRSNCTIKRSVCQIQCN